MTATELLKYQIDLVGAQLERAYSGLEGASASYRLHEGGMSIGEQVAHLAEAYQAVITHAGGGEHKWGTFQTRSSDLAGIIGEAKELREKAAALVLKGDEASLKMGADYIVNHDGYHLGQLVTIRLGLNPAWNSYEIYG